MWQTSFKNITHAHDLLSLLSMNQQNNALPCCLNLIFCFSKDFERQENEKKKTRKPFC